MKFHIAEFAEVLQDLLKKIHALISSLEGLDAVPEKLLVRL
jgi:hypothetical protein